MDREQVCERAVLIEGMGKRIEHVTEELVKVYKQLAKAEQEKISNSLKMVLDNIVDSLEKQCLKMKEQLVENKVENIIREECVPKEKILLKKKAIHMLGSYICDMKRNELSNRTMEKYKADIDQWLKEAPEIITKADILGYKEKMYLGYKAASANSKVISVNRYLKWLGYKELRVKTRKIQNANGLENVITKENYMKMLSYAKSHNKKKMYYIMKTIAYTGIRVGELQFVTVEALQEGSTIVSNKGKYRAVYFTDSLCQELLYYCEKCNITSGIIFCGRKKGKAITPGAVWKGLKYIAKKLEIPENMVYPHSFRHLFAKEYMRKIGDISELADILGHSRLETTWIYTKTTSDEKRSKLELLEL